VRYFSSALINSPKVSRIQIEQTKIALIHDYPKFSTFTVDKLKEAASVAVAFEME